MLAPGRYACFVTQDVRIEKRLYPIEADLVHIMVYEVGFARIKLFGESQRAILEYRGGAVS